MNAVVRQHIRLTFRGSSAVTAHGREDEGPCAVIFPEAGNRFHNRRDIRYAAAAYADCDAGPGWNSCEEIGARQLGSNVFGNARDGPIRKRLLREYKSRQNHAPRILLSYWKAQERGARLTLRFG